MAKRIFRYEAIRDSYVHNRLFKAGEQYTFDVELQGVPSHHFKPLDGGPVTEAPENSIFNRRQRAPRAKAAKRVAGDDPKTLREVAQSRTTASAVGESDQYDFDTLVKKKKGELQAMAKKRGLPASGSKAALAQRILGAQLEE